MSEPESDSNSASDSDSEIKPIAKPKKTKAIAVSVKKEVVKNLAKSFDEVESKKKHIRKAPAQHANLYSEGDTEMGLDGRMWEVKACKNGTLRWVAL